MSGARAFIKISDVMLNKFRSTRVLVVTSLTVSTCSIVSSLENRYQKRTQALAENESYGERLAIHIW